MPNGSIASALGCGTAVPMGGGPPEDPRKPAVSLRRFPASVDTQGVRRLHPLPLGALLLACLLPGAAGATSFAVHQLVVDTGSSPTGEVQSATQAVDIMTGDYNPGDYVFSDDITTTALLIDYAGGQSGLFTVDNPWPNGDGTGATEQFAVRVQAQLLIPAGTWTIAFGGDDGGALSLFGIGSFLTEFNTDGDAGLDQSIFYDSPRAYDTTAGSFQLLAPTTVFLDAYFFENDGADAFEIMIAPGQNFTVDSTNFSLLGDGVLGWAVTAPEPSSGVLFGAGVALLAWRRRRR